MPSNWTAVGNAITARLDEISMQQKDLSAMSGVSVATIREIQGGKDRRRGPRILRDLSKALDWPDDYLSDLLHGRNPDQRPQETREPGASAVQSDPSVFLNKLAFVLEQRIGQVVDVIYNNDADVDITIEIRHSPRER